MSVTCRGPTPAKRYRLSGVFLELGWRLIWIAGRNDRWHLPGERADVQVSLGEGDFDVQFAEAPVDVAADLTWRRPVVVYIYPDAQAEDQDFRDLLSAF